MKKYKCVIIDDEQPARDLINNFIEQIPFLTLTGSFKNPLLAIDLLNNEDISIVFLDIHMPEITGVDFLRNIEIKPSVIFTTAYPDYAMDGYDLNVIDYLLKPFSFERFLRAVNKALKINSSDNDDNQTKYISNMREYISLKCNHKLINVKYDDILYVEGLAEYVSFHTVDSSKYIVLDSLKKLEVELPSEFLRVHRSYIVSTNKVSELMGNTLKIEGREIPVGKNYKKDVLKLIFGKD
ncbi:MAG: LytTR family DNA-binding domain-containing protein [Marinifilaceae bacterium]|jgi:DNA-binding LytR/AlgR family response regulator|nr:LytTR family DNA-binding domain-containing protein [Marinifilaceae bacterium]